MSHSIGNYVDGTGITVDLGEGEMISDVLVLVKTVAPDGEVALRSRSPESMSWIERIGILEAALTLERHHIVDGEL